jgi:hypothetical protein
MQKPKQITWAALGVALIALGTSAPRANAQSAEALMDALVRKGILTEQEAEDIKADVSKENKQFNKWSLNKDGLEYKLYGDVRGRYELFRTDNDTPGLGANNKPRDRFRYRLRAGLTVSLNENFEAGMRLTSSEAVGTSGGDPISGNSTFQDNGSKKFIYLDTAYGKWTFLTNSHGTKGHFASATVGKMDNPFVFSDMVFDGDYTPEGFALQGGYVFNDQHSLKTIGGLFILDEINQGALASDDPLMWGMQLRWDANWVTDVEKFPKIQTSAGLAWLALSETDSLGNGAVPNVNAGNTRFTTTVPGSTHMVAGNLVNDYAPIIADASVTFTFEKAPLYPGQFPIRLAGEFMHNPRADEDENGWWAGVFFGKAGKRGTWEASYRYKRLESDAWFEEFVDSDFGAHREVALDGSGLGNGYRSGTGLHGHITKVAYSFSDSMSLGATWFYTQLIDEPRVGGSRAESGQHRLQVDAVWKF